MQEANKTPRLQAITTLHAHEHMKTRSQATTAAAAKSTTEDERNKVLQNAEVVVATTPVGSSSRNTIAIRFHYRTPPQNTQPWTLGWPIAPDEKNPPMPTTNTLLMSNPFLNTGTIVQCGHSFDAMQITYHVLANKASCPQCNIGSKNRADPIDFHQFDFARDINRCILTLKNY